MSGRQGQRTGDNFYVPTGTTPEDRWRLEGELSGETAAGALQPSRQRGGQPHALPVELLRRALVHQFDDLFAAPPAAIEQDFERAEALINGRARRLADAIPAVFARQGERLAAHH
jgi:hypothetical protein